MSVQRINYYCLFSPLNRVVFISSVLWPKSTIIYHPLCSDIVMLLERQLATLTEIPVYIYVFI